MKKRILAASVAAASVLSVTGCLTGCSPDYSGTPSKEGEDVLTILTWSGNSDNKNLQELFCQETGIPMEKVNFVGCGADGQAARDQYAQYLKGKTDADLMICDADWIAQYANNDKLTQPVSAIGLNKSDFTNAYEYTLAWGTNDNGDFMAPTFQATPGGFVYRADLAEQYLGVKTPAEMQAKISDWDKFQATAKELKDKGGVAIQATEGGLWQVFQANRSKPWVVGGKLEMDNAADFYDIAKTMKDNGYLADVPQWKDAWYAAIKDGTALGDFVPTWGLTQAGDSILTNFTGGAESDLAKKMAICEGPSGWFWGGSYICVAKKCNSKDMAKQFLEFYCKNTDSMRKYAEKTGDFVNNKEVMSDITFSNPMLNGQNHYEILVNVLGKLDLNGKITKYDSVIKGHFNTSVTELLGGTVGDKDSAIASFKKKVKESFSEINVG